VGIGSEVQEKREEGLGGRVVLRRAAGCLFSPDVSFQC
jgi:hypothetical protein